MKTSFAAIAIALASVATAQLDNIPSCALSCFVTVLTTDGCSGLTDFACHCKKTDLIPQVEPCVQKSCPADQQQKVISAVEGTCASAGVPISIAVPGASSAASVAASSAVVASSSAAVASSAAAVSSAKASSAAPVYTPAPIITSSVLSKAASSTLVGTGKVTASHNGTLTATAAPSQFTGAASQATHAAGLMAAAALALAAAL